MSQRTASFGDLLRHLRSAAALSQEDLAERAGLSRTGSVTWSAGPGSSLGWRPCACWPMPLLSETTTVPPCWPRHARPAR